MQDPLRWIDDELTQLEAAGLRRERTHRLGPQGAQIQVANRQYLNFSSNDYLGLAADDLSASTMRVIETCGWGAGASPLVTGCGGSHTRLEHELSVFEGSEAALLFSSGYAANVGVLTALVGKGDIVFSDAKNHASIIDGCRLSGGRIAVYAHADCADLAAQLADARHFRRRLIVTDALFSMDGDLAPLAELAELAEMHDATLMVDEAHATGVFGETGRGITEFLSVEAGVHVRVGTLSKALGSIGGFVVGSHRLIEWLAQRARPYVYSTATPEAAVAAGLKALEIVRKQPQRRQRLLAIAENLRSRLAEQGWELGRAQGQIVPIYIGPAEETMRLSAALRERGLWVPGIRPPSVPEQESLLRISLSYAHRDEMIQRLLDELKALRSTIGR